MIDTCIVIPCYNEEKRMETLKEEYVSFLENNSETTICFVDDGSKDNTLNVLLDFKNKQPNNIKIIPLKNNQGKAEAVRRGMVYCSENVNSKYISFLDADLSTSLQECLRLKQILINNIDVCFVFGSRIAKVGSTIEIDYFRFLVGRIIATFISKILQLKVYDTQCGCKVFKGDIVPQLFKESFTSKWLFDVELFFRMYKLYGKKEAVAKMKEVPLDSWIDPGGSKVSFTYFFRLWIDLYKIKSRYLQYR